MRVSSIRLRLILLAAASIAVTLIGTGLALRLIFERHVERRLEQELLVKWDELATSFSVDATGMPVLIQALSDPRYQRPLSGVYWQVSNGIEPALRSRSLWDDVIPGGPPAEDHNTDAVERVGPKGSTVYVVERQVAREVDGVPRRYTLSVALDHAEINALRDSFVADAALVLSVLGLALLAGAAAQTAFGLRPLRRLARQLGAVHSGHSARLSGSFPDEVAPLAKDLNLLLEEQEKQVAKARERAADLAHGLKTPLTILAGEARQLEEDGIRESAALLREQVELMRGHIERELALVRSRGATPAASANASLLDTTEKLVRLLKRVERGGDLIWAVRVPPDMIIGMDPFDLGEVLGNLLDNARKWARSSVVVSARREGECIWVGVTDDGPGIPTVHRARLAERGERGSSHVDGSGLGLAIVTGVLDSYSATLSLDSDERGSTFSFVVRAQSACRASKPPKARPPGRMPARRLTSTRSE